VLPLRSIPTFRLFFCLDLHGCRPDDAGNKHLWNVGELLWKYKVQYPRRLSASYSWPRESEISKNSLPLLHRVLSPNCLLGALYCGVNFLLSKGPIWRRGLCYI
jgi:hypothetical protein